MLRQQYKRLFSTARLTRNQDPFARDLSLSELTAQVKSVFSNGSTEKISKEQVINALKACNRLEAQFKESSAPGSPLPETPVIDARRVIDEILKNEAIPLDSGTLKEVFMSSPAPSSYTSIELLKAFNKRHSYGVVPGPTALIPFRRAAYNAEFDEALKIMDLTLGKESHHGYAVQKKRRKYFAGWAGSVGSALGGMHLLFHSGWIGVWNDTNMIITAIGTYLSTVSIYAYLAFAGRVSGSGDILSWVTGTRLAHRYGNATEMKMGSILAQINMSLPENQGQCSTKLVNELAKRDMKVIETEDEIMLREYWSTSGEGFEWTEPDQDPAEILWRAKMDKERAQRIGQPYSRKDPDPRNEEVFKTLPHASLVDIPNRNELPRPPVERALPEN